MTTSRQPSAARRELDPRELARRDVRLRLMPASLYGWSAGQRDEYWAEIARLYAAMGRSPCATAFRATLADDSLAA